MNTFVISVEDKRELTVMLEEYAPFLHSEAEQMTALRRKLEEAVVVPAAKLARSVVSLGSKVRVVDLRRRDEEIYTLVLPGEANASRRLVSVLSPLGTAILGCEEGAIVEVAIPLTTIPFAVLKVLYQPQWDEPEVVP